MKNFKKILLITIAVILIACGTVLGLELSNTTHWFHKPASQIIVKAGDTSKLTQPNSGDKGKNLSSKNPTSNTSRPIGGATDTGGSVNTRTDSGQWITSQSGAITVKQPLANSRLEPGGVLSGSAKTNTVEFRLIDNVVGVIARGELHVVNGQFSGKLDFETNGSDGRLDVFTRAPNGAELNEVQIAVRF